MLPGAHRGNPPTPDAELVGPYGLDRDLRLGIEGFFTAIGLPFSSLMLG